MKISKMERDLPKFIRGQRQYVEKFDREIARVQREGALFAGGIDTDAFLD